MTVASAQAQTERRVALVIGNSGYQNTSALTNPAHDAADIVAALKRLGFEVVDGRDLDKRSMERTIRQFGIKLAGADVALFFYAGHGLQVGGQNYLVPTDARLGSEGDVDFETVALNLVLKQMEREAKTSLVLLDACRDNPLARNLARSMGTRASYVSQGLAEVRTGVGTLIGFSTQPGHVALDGAGRNSPYAAALLRHMETPSKDISAILVSVRNEVLKVTSGSQVPWEHTSLTGQVFLKKEAPPITATVPQPGSNERDLELAFWNSVKDSKSPAVIEAYVARYPNGTFAGLANVLIAQLRETSSPAQPPGKVASLPQRVEPLSPALPKAERIELARTLQTELRRVGCDPGSVDGQWGPKAQAALQQFARLAKVEVPGGEPSAAALEAVLRHKSRVCPLTCSANETETGGRCVAKGRTKSKPQQADRPVKKDTARRKPSDDGNSAKPSGGMCWAVIGRVSQIVPCSHPLATNKAY
jgi:hypothetical protein